MMTNLSSIPVVKKSWKEFFLLDGDNLPLQLRNFRERWFSNLSTNNLRGILAEYIVASAVWCSDKPREERDAYDLLTKDGIKVEVKSASYIQSREQKDYSNISFSIRPTKGWDDEWNREQIVKRQSDIYVFCLLAHKSQETLNPIDLNQWEFYVVSTRLLNEQVGKQKSISLWKLSILSIKSVWYEKIYDEIKRYE